MMSNMIKLWLCGLQGTESMWAGIKGTLQGNTLTKIRVKWDYMAGKGLEMNPEKTFSGQLGKSWQWLLP